jgi:thiol peroxidase
MITFFHILEGIMASITLKGKQLHTSGELPALGTKAPDFLLTGADLSDFRLADFEGKVKILNIVPSLDTGVCAASARKFEKEVKDLAGVVVLTVSRDLPFAQSRFCKAEGIGKVVALYQLRSEDFGRDYGVRITDGPMEGLLARAVVVLGRDNKVVYAEQVPEIADEPKYDKALNAARKARSRA